MLQNLKLLGHHVGTQWVFAFGKSEVLDGVEDACPVAVSE
jgi:hypothetical protein